MIHKKIEVKHTEKKGRGIFAAEEIKKGEKVITFIGPLYTKAEAEAKNRLDHALPIGIDVYVDAGEPELLINHSCEPNTGFISKDTLVALRDIHESEEITFDYSLVTDDDWVMECACGSPHCRKTISNFRDLPQELKEKYRSITPQWILDLDDQKKK